VTETLETSVKTPVELPDNPYVGLVPFGERDAPFFFGRERERRLIANNLIASRLTLLYGASGVGKSSVLRAGVAHDIRRLARRELAEGRVPEWILVVFSEWRDPPLPLLAAAIETAVADALGERAPDPPRADRLDELLAEWVRRIDAVPSDEESERRTRLLIVLDQFEEYFLYHWPDEDRGKLGEELPRALNREGLRANFAISIREDAYSQLDRFKGRIPNLFESYLRIRHLDPEAARRAITQPVLETWNGLLAEVATRYEIEDDLVDEVLEQVRTGSFVLGQAGGGSVGEASERRVEAPYLQLVMRRLWEDTVEAGEHRLTRARLLDLGGAEAIVRSHLQDAMDTLEPRERDLAARIFHQLVTPEGTKIAHTVGALASYAEVESDELEPTLKTLSDGRILRPVDPPAGQSTPRYEIYHDVLAAPILDWCAAHVRGRQESERREAEQRSQRTKRNRAIAGVLAVGLAVSVGLAVWALAQRNDALRQGRLAESQQLANTAMAQLDIDPQRSALVALEALRRSSTPQAEDALRAALAASHLRRVLTGDTAGVVSPVYSADGKRILTASGDGTVRLWDAVTGRELHVFSTHGVVSQATMDVTGTRIVAANRRAGPILWNVRTGRRIPLRGSHMGASTVAFSRDGSLAAAAGEDPRRARTYDVRVWHAADGSLVQTFHGHTNLVYHVEFSPNGRQLVSASADATARIWTLGLSAGVVLRHGNRVNDARFDGDGRRVVTASWAGNVRIWTVDGKRVWSFSLDGRALSAVISPSGDVVAAGSTDRNVHVWNLNSGEAAVLRGHTGAVSSVAFSRGGELVSSSADGTARVWNVRSDALQAVLRGHAGAVRAAAFSPDGAEVVTASEDHTARIWDVSPLPVVKELRVPARRSEHASSIGVVFSEDGRYVLVRRGYDGARVYAASGRLVATLRARGGTLTGGAFSPDGTLVATATATGPVQVWRIPTGRLLRELRGHKPTDLTGSGLLLLIRRVEFSADGRRLVTAGYDGTARIWDVGTWTTLRVLRPPRARYLEAATFSPDGKLVATASGTGGRVRIWDSVSGRLVRTLQTRGGQFCATFSADSKLLVTCGGDGVARIWNVDSGKRQLALRGHSGWILSGTFSPDGTLLATTGVDRTARVWDTATGAVIAVVSGVRGYPAVFSSDGSLLAAAGSIVEARTGDPIANVAAVGDPIVSALSPDGARAATMGFDGVGALLRCDLCRPLPQLLELAKQRVPRGLTREERQRFVGG
jgi:WD40 repeat protein